MKILAAIIVALFLNVSVAQQPLQYKIYFNGEVTITSERVYVWVKELNLPDGKRVVVQAESASEFAKGIFPINCSYHSGEMEHGKPYLLIEGDNLLSAYGKFLRELDSIDLSKPGYREPEYARSFPLVDRKYAFLQIVLALGDDKTPWYALVLKDLKNWIVVN